LVLGTTSLILIEVGSIEYDMLVSINRGLQSVGWIQIQINTYDVLSAEESRDWSQAQTLLCLRAIITGLFKN
jgi:hypothetical protein